MRILTRTHCLSHTLTDLEHWPSHSLSPRLFHSLSHTHTLPPIWSSGPRERARDAVYDYAMVDVPHAPLQISLPTCGKVHRFGALVLEITISFTFSLCLPHTPSHSLSHRFGALPPQRTAAGPTPYILHSTPYNPHPTPTPYTPHPAPHTLNPTPYTLHPTPYTSHPTPHTPHPTPYTLRGGMHRFGALSLQRATAAAEAGRVAVALLIRNSPPT